MIWELFARKSAESLNVPNSFITISNLNNKNFYSSLSGGVAVGCVADLMIQPYGAFLLGSLTGVISCLGYRILQVTTISSYLK